MNILNKLIIFGLVCFGIAITGADAALAAAATVSNVAENVNASAERVPGLITGISYILALLFGVTGVLKLRDHVENPNQTPIRVPLIRFFAGGALLALPIVFEAAAASIGNTAGFGLDAKMYSLSNQSGAIITNLTNSGTGAGINDIMQNIITSISDLPGIVTALAYLLGLVACVVGVLKVRDHVENQEQTPIREGVIRLLIGGALFSLPTIYEAVETTILGTAAGPINQTLNTLRPTVGNFVGSSWADNVADRCDEVYTATGGGLGESICRFTGYTGASPAFLTAISYMFGLVIGVWALLKIRDHVLNPQQTSIWEGMSRLIAAGGFFAMPYLAGVFQSSVSGNNAFVGMTNQFTGWLETAFVTAGCGAAARGLDITMACFMRDILAPMHTLFTQFAFVAGLVFIMIGISRVMKSAQEGARGPGGLGTMMTFITGGILISYNRLIDFFTVSISSLGGGKVATKAALSYTSGMTTAETQHVTVIVATILQFMIIIGIISFIRGWFIIRDVAEGNQQASMMAGATHIIGGALAINLGPILAAVQNTLGITGVGLAIS